MTQQTIDIAFCFLHQKMQVYLHSSISRQRDDIEVAVADYVEQMDHELYLTLADGVNDFLLTHRRFEQDMTNALSRLEQMLSPSR